MSLTMRHSKEGVGAGEGGQEGGFEQALPGDDDQGDGPGSGGDEGGAHGEVGVWGQAKAPPGVSRAGRGERVWGWDQ